MTESIIFGGRLPEFYADTVRTGVSPYTVSLTFGIQSDSEATVSTQCVVRMSPQHALVLARVLQSNLEAYEEQIGKIDLPEQLFTDIGLKKSGGAGDGAHGD